MSTALELCNVTCARGGHTLFSELTLTLQPGQLLYVQGANGSGKTSLLRMVCGLLQPVSGKVLWRGRPVASLREEFGRDVAYLGHAAALKDDMSPVENLLAACGLGGQSASRLDAMGALAEAGLPGLENTPVRHLSQGQRRRSALARMAMARSSPLWVLDEPFNALDTKATHWLKGLITGHLLRSGLVVLTSHQDLGPGLDATQMQVLAL